MLSISAGVFIRSRSPRFCSDCLIFECFGITIFSWHFNGFSIWGPVPGAEAQGSHPLSKTLPFRERDAGERRLCLSSRAGAHWGGPSRQWRRQDTRPAEGSQGADAARCVSPCPSSLCPAARPVPSSLPLKHHLIPSVLLGQLPHAQTCVLLSLL